MERSDKNDEAFQIARKADKFLKNGRASGDQEWR
jgi:hypothetical protein